MNFRQKKHIDEDHIKLEATISKAIGYAKLKKKNYCIVYRQKQKIYDFIEEGIIGSIREEIAVLDTTDRIMIKRNISYDTHIKKTSEN